MAEMLDPIFMQELRSDSPEELYGLCARGICPVNIDSFSACPVMECASKSCGEIRLQDWARLLSLNPVTKLTELLED